MIISTHSLTKRLTARRHRDEALNHISTHSLTKRLTRTTYVCSKYRAFQLTASRRGWRAGNCRAQGQCQFQLTASRRGWRSITSALYCGTKISTHSLTKRLTIIWLFSGGLDIFQLTASRRGWQRKLQAYNDIWVFQLTASRRGWQSPACHKVCNFNISTHSLTKRLTWWRHLSWHWMRYFNSQPHEEADGVFRNRRAIVREFQLTASRRGWQNTDCTHRKFKIFQLTASRRGWPFSWLRNFENFIFQLTASRRGWPSPVVSLIDSINFNSQPHEEADDCRWTSQRR